MVTSIPTKDIVIPDDFKIKNHDETLINKLRTATQRHGQPSLVHVTTLIPKDGVMEYQVIGGHEVAWVVRELALDKTYVKVYDSIPEAVLAVLEQEIRFQTDYFKVAGLVSYLNKNGIPCRRIQHSVPWSEFELNNMLKMSQFDWEKFGEPDQDENQISLF